MKATVAYSLLFLLTVNSKMEPVSVPPIRMDAVTITVVKEVIPPYSIPKRYIDVVTKSAVDNGIPVWLLARLIEYESSWNSKTNRKNMNGSRDLGIAQFNDRYLTDYYWFDNGGKKFDPMNPYEAIPVMARYLKRLYRATGEWRLAVLAYNVGLSRVRRWEIPKIGLVHMKRIMNEE
jgi:soluble lytic murein transglycosylase-like protein